MDYESRMYALAAGTLAAVECPAIDGDSWHCGNCYEAIVSHDMTTCPKCGAEVWVEAELAG